MFSRLTLIFFLALALAAFLVLRPYIFAKAKPPSIEDRLPDGDFLGHAKILGLAKEAQALLYFYKVPYREFLSEEFILAQAKNYGLQIQNACYLFGNQDGSWGSLIELNDSTKVHDGILKLKHLFPMSDTLIANKKVYRFNDFDGYITYDNDYLFFYFGKSPRKYINHVVSAKANQVSFNWINFLNSKDYLSKNLAIFSNWKNLKDLTISEAFAYPVIDSTHITLYTHLVSKDTIPIQLKPKGLNFKENAQTEHLINLHLDHSRLKNAPTHPFYQYLVKLGRKISFPTSHFLQIWDGDLNFTQGGLVTSKEKYIESELDENFEVSMVEKEREVKVPGFALAYSTNDSGLNYFKHLLTKGVLTEQEDGYHFLVSPPLRVEKTRKKQVFYSSLSIPKSTLDSISFMRWKSKGTAYTFTIDSIHTFDFYGNIKFPLDKILATKNLTF